MTKQENEKDNIGYNGHFPLDRVVLPFHRESFGIYDGKIKVEFLFHKGECKEIEVSRMSWREKNAE